MKKIFTVLVLAGLGLSSCQKDNVAPKSDTSPKTTTPVTTATAPTDTVKGYLRVQLAMNATAIDDVLIDFNPAANPKYSGSQDARTFDGMGAVTLSSLSSDGYALAINQLPLVSTGTTVGLVVNAQATGVYKLNLTTISSTIPSTVNIWLKDMRQKDSLDFRRYPSYAFNINKSDSTTYGSHRFKLVLREQ
ncbi:MAG TPA: hypothetical protein VFE53_09970 [Mucilaginibacter sp.]|jgi:hypothetical protein|nr:hypothetical protein [Mucilaginibacter sp.]